MSEIEVGEGDVLVQGTLYFRRDIKEKWKKLQARLVFISSLHALRLSEIKDPEKTIDTITITKDLVTVGPIPEKDRSLFHLVNSRKQVHLSCKNGSNIVTDWINVIECVAETKRDPSKYIGEEFLRQKIVAKLTSSETLTGDVAKVAQIANIVAKNARGFTEVELLRKEIVDSLEDKITEKRDRIVLELLQTEQSYLRSLSVLTNVFKLPLKKYMKDLSLSEEDLITLFGNLDDIVRVSTTLFAELLKCFRDWSNQKLISTPLLQTIPFLKMYNQYSVNYNNSVACLNRLKKKSEEFKTFVDKVVEDPVCAGLDLGSYLIMPIQRIPRYVLLLTELIKNTPNTHPDHEGLTKVLNAMKDIADNVNYAPQQQEQLDNTLIIIQKFEKYKEHNLIQPGRKFIRQSEGRHGVKKRQYFLMSDMLICASERSSGKYSIHHKFRGSKISLEDDPTQPNAIIIHRDKDGPYIINTTTAEEKKIWIDKMKELQEIGFRNSIDFVSEIEEASNVDEESTVTRSFGHRPSISKTLPVRRTTIVNANDVQFREFLNAGLSLEKYLATLKIESELESEQVKEELTRLKTKIQSSNSIGNAYSLEFLSNLCTTIKTEIPLKIRVFGQTKFSDTITGDELISWLRLKKSLSETEALNVADEMLKHSIIIHCPKDNLPFTRLCCFELKGLEQPTAPPKLKTKRPPLSESKLRSASLPMRRPINHPPPHSKKTPTKLQALSSSDVSTGYTPSKPNFPPPPVPKASLSLPPVSIPPSTPPPSTPPPPVPSEDHISKKKVV